MIAVVLKATHYSVNISLHSFITNNTTFFAITLTYLLYVKNVIESSATLPSRY